MRLLNKNTVFFFTFAFSSFASHAATTTQELARINIELSGEVVTSVCGVVEAETNKYVDLGVHSLRGLKNIGDKTQPVMIPFNLGNCHPGSPVTITFSGIADSSNSEFLALENATNAAQSVAIEILDAEKNRLAINTKSKSMSVDERGNISTRFYANYIVTRSSIAPGLAQANANFTIQYD